MATIVMSDLSEQEAVRYKKRQSLKERGIDPYPAAAFLTNTNTQAILGGYSSAPQDYQNVAIAGRIMNRRIMGAVSFLSLQDAHGSIQLYVHRDTLCKGDDKAFYDVVFKKLLDIGDIIGINGFVFTTKTNAVTIHVTKLCLLSKALKPLPLVKKTRDVADNELLHHDVTNLEQRYRQRYLDLIIHPSVRQTFRKRAQVIHTIRTFLGEQGYLEVETPILQPVCGGASARPFVTYHHALQTPLYLRVANELYLKRLIVGGYEGVYEFAKDFRNEGLSRFHNPEFTQVELYVAYKDYMWMMEQVELMIERVAHDLYGTTEVAVGNQIINFQRPWKRFTLFDAIEHCTGMAIGHLDEEGLRRVSQQLNVFVPKDAHAGKLIDAIFSARCEPHFIQPTIITDYPVFMSPLAKRCRNNTALVERFEVICNKKEICNAFSELNDPVEQYERFEAQHLLRKRGDEEAMQLDRDFLRALAYAMPPTAGVGMGIDRLVMIMTNSPSIQDVIFFPQMGKETT